MNQLEKDNLQFKLQIAESNNRIERQQDEMYLVRGGQLVSQEPAMLVKFHAIVLDEMDLTSEELFYKQKEQGTISNPVEKMARDVLFYMLNKHASMSWKEIGANYGFTITSGRYDFDKLMANPGNRPVIESIERRIIDALVALRPHDSLSLQTS